MAKRGNPHPAGSKPDKILRNALLLALNREDKDATTGRKVKRIYRIADQLSKQAADGDIPAIKEVWDRVEGKATQQVDLNATEGFEALLDRISGH